MSYTRHYSDTIYETVHISGSVSYPASQNGGSTSVTLSKTISIPVNVSIDVNTIPFDSSVRHCGSNVNLLTDAVVAVESATILSKRKNSKKVADTIIGGFFSYVKSEISQQISEISQNLDAQLMHISELTKACLSKKKQMEGDYNRITGRYIKTFTDLNNELANRIHQLDKPVFHFRKDSDQQKARAFSNDLTTTVSVFGKESCSLQSKVCVSIAKKRAADTLGKAKLFLWQQKQLASTIQHSMLNESKADNIFITVCFVEFSNEKQVDKNVYCPDYLSVLQEKENNNRLLEKFSADNCKWTRISPADEKGLSFYFNKELNANMPANNMHSTRVREMIQSISKLSSINVIN
jgi:hypothetical protein